MSEPVVELQGVTVTQEERAVLERVSFGLEKSEFVYLVGRTGSGKSSLLKTLYADLPLQVGAGTVAGFDLERLPPGKVPYLRRRLGIVFQDFQLLSDRTVGENLLFVLNATGWRGKARKQQRVQEVLMQVGLSGVGGRMPHRLSGGEQQRVVIARALLNEPTLLLADEPTGNLDPEVADGIMALFAEINHAGTAILMATHNFQLLEKYPHRVLTCQDGALLDSGSR
ncbi:ATP-binding cassette domain-containing protein [Hymenobacter sp. UV11]|uniref:cell division ATP-binding protein FtsE n=1 Tax=Hymenobacter sp. UV11 TaxID=1849735 RepID=UPI0010604126|nr:ATP-binding cassette domain-containing protein [Hymenobacter sp. UV11]TDN37905.1 phosphonate ABC transporter ATP-binding protein [Hymenobacter sp. UV11]TFZ65117.1 ATP-binding cassette domain-containing protein [Hymenobacter sp. UV11]